jgi:hypothetical protein
MRLCTSGIISILSSKKCVDANMSMKKYLNFLVLFIKYYLSRETVTLINRSHVEEPEVSQRTEHQRKALYSGTIFHMENVKNVTP